MVKKLPLEYICSTGVGLDSRKSSWHRLKKRLFVYSENIDLNLFGMKISIVIIEE